MPAAVDETFTTQPVVSFHIQTAVSNGKGQLLFSGFRVEDLSSLAGRSGPVHTEWQETACSPPTTPQSQTLAEP